MTSAAPRAPMRVAAHGISVHLPAAWEARIYLRPGPSGEVEHLDGAEVRRPVAHLANFALPPGRGDFGTGAVELMRPHHAFMSIFEYDEAEAGRPLFAAAGIPTLDLADFAPNALQRRIVGQLGCQRFFTEHARAFCLYVVLGSRRHAPNLLGDVREITRRLAVGLR